MYSVFLHKLDKYRIVNIIIQLNPLEISYILNQSSGISVVFVMEQCYSGEQGSLWTCIDPLYCSVIQSFSDWYYF